MVIISKLNEIIKNNNEFNACSFNYLNKFEETLCMNIFKNKKNKNNLDSELGENSYSVSINEKFRDDLERNMNLFISFLMEKSYQSNSGK